MKQHEYFIAIWQRPWSERTPKGIRFHYGESELFHDESALLRECLDRDCEPEEVVRMVSDGRVYRSEAYRFDLDRAKRDAEAERRQYTPHWG